MLSVCLNCKATNTVLIVATKQTTKSFNPRRLMISFDRLYFLPLPSPLFCFSISHSPARDLIRPLSPDYIHPDTAGGQHHVNPRKATQTRP